MRFWERFSKITFNLFVRVSGNKIQVKLIESVLKNAVAMIDPESLKQMRSYVINQQTSEGGFPDRAGKCDVYYSLFGYYIAEALDVTTINAPLKHYVNKIVRTNNLSGINLHCASILYAKLFGLETFPIQLKKKVLNDLHQTGSQLPIYSNFLSLLTYYYIKDLKGIYRIIKGLKASDQSSEMPCPVTAAQLVLLSLARKPFTKTKERLMSFYREKGGFTALQNTPTEDLLSTAVALYALNYTDSDIRLIKPDCLAYVDSLFHDGGFRSTEPDVEIDIEYTFYGLLALGSLNN
jgi:prenyltransferase beta subunit